jgi:hypothetical protein
MTRRRHKERRGHNWTKESSAKGQRRRKMRRWKRRKKRRKKWEPTALGRPFHGRIWQARMERDALEVSLPGATTGQASASIPSAPPIAGGAVLEVEPPREGLVSLRVDAGSSQSLVHVGGDLHKWVLPFLSAITK